MVATNPRLPDGTPFPTYYYLTHPAATAAVSTLEAEGQDGGVSRTCWSTRSPTRYRARASRRTSPIAQAVAVVPEIEGISAGGMPTA